MIAFTDILRRAALAPESCLRLRREMTFLTLESLDGYQRLLTESHCAVLECQDLSAWWTEILVQRLAMYRSLKKTTVARFGAQHFHKWDDTYAFFVGRFAAGELGGGRFVARRHA